MEFVAVCAIEGDAKATFFHSGERQDVSNAIRVVPDLSISGKIANQVGACHSCVAVYVHKAVAAPDVLEKFGVVEDVDG